MLATVIGDSPTAILATGLLMILFAAIVGATIVAKTGPKADEAPDGRTPNDAAERWHYETF